MEHRKIAWVSWKIVCMPKLKGGLGVKDLRTFNSALLGKWRWDMFYRQMEPWARNDAIVIREVHEVAMNSSSSAETKKLEGKPDV